jgi:outer membrane protein OmpU
MKKLLCSAAVCGLALAANPAQAADGLKLDIGGYFKGYMAYVDQDDDAGEVNDFDIIRDTEVHFGGETTLDNGLTVGMHFEAEADGGDSFDVDESYAYFSGGWGRVNFGSEDGAAYLLQVEAPSADDNIDGLRQYVQPVNYDAVTGLPGFTAAVLGAEGLDYDQDISGKSDKISYLTPVLNGFQAGVSFTPDSDGFADDLEGIGLDDEADVFGRTYEAALRYEGQFNNVGVILGAGYSNSQLEDEAVDGVGGDFTEDRQAWNVGADFDIGPFGLGAAYVSDNQGESDLDGVAGGDTADEEETWVLGADYTTGPFKLGASYMNKDNTLGLDGIDTDRYSGGVTYTYGPGMTFRGSVGYVDHEADGGDDEDATYVTVGTQINF